MKNLLALILLLIPFLLHAQEQDSVYFVKNADFTIADGNNLTSGTRIRPDTTFRTWHPDPYKAVWLGAIVPGLGQIYNRSYWKLPIVYGGLMGCAYAITWNQGMYNDYKRAYVDLYYDRINNEVSENPSRSYIAIIPKGYNLEKVGGTDTWLSTLQEQQTIYRRYRDISIVATIVVYALSLVDAYVDAQLFDFDISPDLSLNVEPQLYFDLMQQRCTELKLAITF